MNNILKNTSSESAWNRNSWTQQTAKQQPTYPDKSALIAIEQQLEKMPPLIFAGEVRNLGKKMAAICKGESFLLQGGDCAESFAEFSANNIRDTFKLILQMAVVLTYGLQMPIVKIGRIAGQYAKPRSGDTETQGDITLPSYRGDIINSIGFTSEDRTPDPQRMLTSYYQSAVTLNLLRAFSTGGLANLHHINDWNLDFARDPKLEEKYQHLAHRISKGLAFMKACGIDKTNPLISETEVFTSHEALLLNYEQALTRKDSVTGKWYDCSAHMLWIGERTRNINEAHVEFLRGVENPIGIKISDTAHPDDLSALCHQLNPNNIPGRITFITRMGADKLPEVLPSLIRQVTAEGLNVVWSCDPMHANTRKASNGYKTRELNSILREVRTFFEIHQAEGSYPGGIHLEMTGTDVTECLGGLQSIVEVDLAHRYHTHCDPRLNATQALELSFAVADQLKP